MLHSIPCLTKLAESGHPEHVELCKMIAVKLQHHLVVQHDELVLDEVFVVERGEMKLHQIGGAAPMLESGGGDADEVCGLHVF